jgi:hypothetical protein
VNSETKDGHCKALPRSGFSDSVVKTQAGQTSWSRPLDITQLILDDHREQRRLFAMIEQIGSDNAESLAAVWKRLETFLEVHAETEEKIFYPALLRIGRESGDRAGVETETLDAIKDHNEIRDAIAAVSYTRVGSAEWIKAVAAANKANSDHMAEEEREGLSDFRRHASLEYRHELAIQFAAYETSHITGVKPVDKDPKKWVEDHG